MARPQWIGKGKKGYDPEMRFFAPKLVVVRGFLLVRWGGQSTPIGVDQEFSHPEHGRIVLKYAGEDYGVIEHIDLNCRSYVIFIQPRSHVALSNGKMAAVEDGNYAVLWESWMVREFARLLRTEWADGPVAMGSFA